MRLFCDLAKGIKFPVKPQPTGIVHHIPHAAQLIRKGPQRFVLHGAEEIMHLFVRQQLIDGRAPEVAMRQIASLDIPRAGLVEPKHNLTVVMNIHR
jgi:hypothetical protein